MSEPKIKIFLSYHKNSPCYKSEIFQPVHVGSCCNNTTIDFAISDNTGDNISKLNPYYCELTGHYWVLKNYLPTSSYEYIGFAHYRRLPDLLNVSETDTPSIFGIGYKDSLELFDRLNNENLYNKCRDFDIICPCSCYMYKNTVNPLLRDNEPNYSVSEHFKEEHNSDLLSCLEKVIRQDYPEFEESLKRVFESKKSHFYNIYIMRKDILKQFLDWEFDILFKIGNMNEGWKHTHLKRMAGFVGEALINIWIDKFKQYKVGYVPIYMIDFESDLVSKIIEYQNKNDYQSELKELWKLYDITSDKFTILINIIQTYITLGDNENITKYLDKALSLAQTGEDYYELATVSSQNTNIDKNKVKDIYLKAITAKESIKLYAQSFLSYSEKVHDIELTKLAWDFLLEFQLSDEEKEKYTHFQTVYKMINR